MGLGVANISIVITLEYSKEKNNQNEMENKVNKEITFRTEEKNMEKNLEVNFRQTTNYLIQLFYKTGKQYSCTRTKLGKLLTIVSFVYARRGEKLFSESILEYNNCGTTFNSLVLFVGREVYLGLQYNDNKKYISLSFDENAGIPSFYNDTYEVNDEIKNVVEKVFRNFGAYTASDLGALIVPIINMEGIINSDGEVELKKIYQMDKAKILADNNDNELVRFIFEG